MKTGRGLDEKQIPSKRDWLSEHTAAQLQKDRHASLNRTAGFVAAAIGQDLHIAYTLSSSIRRAVALVYLQRHFTLEYTVS